MALAAKPALADGVAHGEVFDVRHHGCGWIVPSGIALRLGLQQVAGVGMAGSAEDALRRARFHDFAVGHHAHPVRHRADDAEVVRDEQHRHAHLGAQLAQQVQNLRLNGHVQSGGGLVGNEQARLVGEGHRDHHPLALASRQFMRIGAQPPLGVPQAHPAQQVQRAQARRLGPQPLMHHQRFAHLLIDGVQGVEGRHRLLEDHAHLAAAHVEQTRLVRADHLFALHQNAAVGMAGEGVGQQLQHGKRGDGLPRAGFAHQGDGFSGRDVEGNARYGFNLAKADVQVTHFEEFVRHCAGFLKGARRRALRFQTLG